MKYPKWDFYSLSDAIVFGVRPSVSMDDDTQKYEVYVKLVSGQTVTTARDGTKEEAQRALERLLKRLQSADIGLLLTLDGLYVDLSRIIRVYVDTQPNGYVAIAEDVTGESHRLVQGDRDECKDVVMDIVGLLSSLQNESTPGEQE